jgi:hypothetical protein
MLLMFPAAWIAVIPGNFLIDSLVLILSMIALKMSDRKRFYWKHILQIFLLGFLSDIIAAGIMLLLCSKFEIGGNFADGPLLTVPGVLIAAALIFVFNYYITFRKDEKSLRMRLSLIFAIATAPYTFLIPSSLLYAI